MGGVDAAKVADARRVLLGKEIASRPETIEKIGIDVWSVTSQTTFGRYRVLYLGDTFSCSCPDYLSRTAPCKHIYAVRCLYTSGRSLEVKISKVRTQYLQHPTYNRAQTEEMRLVDKLLHDLLSEVPDFPKAEGKAGRPPIPFRDQLYCAILKVYSGLSGARARGVYQNVADRGLLGHVPSYAVASNLLTRAEATPVLYSLLRFTAIPLAGLEEGGAISPDSTGIQTTSFGAWREEKQGEKRVKRWLKVHAIVGTKTHVIIDARVLEANSADAPQFRPLVQGALDSGFHPATVPADKGYLSRSNYSFADSVGLQALIPFKSNSIGQAQGSTAWWRAFHLFQADREAFDHRYHLRSNVEAVFSALKRKFGENIRSRTKVAQTNEILSKLICYNLTVVVHEMFESGIAPKFTKKIDGP
jgi:transposase